MNVLDLDMDFFLHGTCGPAAENERPDENEAPPWTEGEVRAFLEVNCGLSRKKRVKGAVFMTHDEALGWWLERADLPLDITHVDAHSDLGVVDPEYVLESVITMPPEKRRDIERYYSSGKLTEANYLLFALALRMVRTLINVRNPHSRPDMPPFCHEGHIKLVSGVSRLIPALDRHEPVIPYTVMEDWRAFKADRPFELATMAISPRYAPKEADFIAGIFSEYIEKAPF